MNAGRILPSAAVALCLAFAATLAHGGELPGAQEVHEAFWRAPQPVWEPLLTPPPETGDADTSGWYKDVPRLSDPDKTEDLEARYDSEWRRYTYPVGHLPRGDWQGRAMDWVRQYVPNGTPNGAKTLLTPNYNGPIPLTANWTSWGPSPLDATGTTNNAYQYGTVVGRVNAIAFDPNNPAVAYVGQPVGGLWKTTNCCSAATTWTQLWYDETFPNNSVGAIAIDSANSNIIYVGTGDSQVPAFDMFGNGIYKSTDGGTTWYQLGANLFSPYTSAGAPGASCCATAPDENIKSIVIDPNNHNTIIAGASYGLFISYDAGATWTQYDVVNRNSATYNTSAQRVTSILIDGNTNPSTMYVALGYPYTSTKRAGLIGGANGVYKATVPSSGAPAFTLLANGFPAGTANGTVSSNVGRIELAWNAAHTHIYAHVDHYANVGQTLGIYHLNVATSTWNLLTGTAETNFTTCGTGGNETDQAWYDLTLDMDPLNDTILYTGRTNLWKVTLNSATAPTSATLSDLSGVYSTTCTQYGTLHPDQHAFAFQPGQNPSRFLVGNDGGVYYGTGASGGFTRTMTGMGGLQFYAGQLGRDFANTSGTTTQFAFGGMQDNGSASWDSSQTNLQWIGRSVGGDGFFTAFDPIAGTRTAGRWITSYSNGSLSCSGTGVQNAFSGCSPAYAASGEREDWSTPYIMDQWNCTATTCGNVVLGTNFVWASVNGGAAWTKVTTADLTKGAGDAISINVAHNNPGSVIVGTSDGNIQWSNNVFTGANCTAAVANSATFACTSNTASTWVNLTGGNAVLPNRSIAGVVFDPTTNTKFYAAVSGFGVNTPATPGHVFMGTCAASPCTTANVTWADKTGNLPDIPVEGIQVNPSNVNQVFIGTNLGFFYTNNITANPPLWNRYQTGMPNTRITYLAVDRGATAATARTSTALSAWTYGRGLFATQIGLPTCDEPPAPAGLTAVPNGANRIDLSWTASAGATSYKIYRFGPGAACPANQYTLLASGVTTTTYSDTTVTGGNTYSYRVTAVVSVCESPVSSCASATASSCTPLAAPASVSATATAPNQISVTWSTVAGASSYKLYRAAGSCTAPNASYTLVASGIAGTSYNDTSVTFGNRYSYKVVTTTGCDSALSTACAWAEAYGDCMTAPTFAGIATAATSGATTCGIDLTWSAGTSNCPGTGSISYTIYRGTSAGFPAVAANRIVSGVSGTSFTDTSSLQSGVTYYYKVRAVDSRNSVEDTNTVERSAAAQASCTAAPYDVQVFTVTATTGQNILQWVNPASGAPGSTIKINFRTDAYPTGPNDTSATVLVTGRPITFGAKDSFTHTGLTNGTTYYYAIWVIY
jgi:fibronectin type 3 domain-containing protein